VTCSLKGTNDFESCGVNKTTKQRSVYRWMLEPADRDAVLANVAIKSGSKGYHVIVEIACVLSSEELLAARRAYHNRYKRSLEEDVATNTTGDLRQVNNLLHHVNSLDMIHHPN